MTFFSVDYMPHGHCYLWNPYILWASVLSDALIFLAYYSIPVMLFYFVKKRKDLAFHRIFILFAIFILACGTTHLLEIWNVWNGDYEIAALIKLVTAVASVATGLVLIKVIPLALAFPSRQDIENANRALAAEVRARKEAQAEVLSLNKALDSRVQVAMQHEGEALAQFQALAETIPQLVWITRGDGTHEYFNRRWYEYTGITDVEIKDKGWSEYIHPEDYPGCRQMWLQSLQSGAPFEAEYRIKSAAGEFRWFLARALPLKNESGELVRWCGTSTDIDGIKNAR